MSYASTTGSRGTGIFDELLVRNPPKTGPLQSVFASVGGDISGKRDVSDSYSRSETASLIAAAGYSETEADSIFQTVVSADAALLLKRDVSDSRSNDESDLLLAGKVDDTAFQSVLATLASTVELEAAVTLLDDETVTRLTTKLDKGAAYTTSESDALFANAADAVSAALSTKRDESQSYTITQIDNLLASRAISDVGGLQASLDEKASITQLNTGLNTKRSIADSYGKAALDDLFDAKASTTALTAAITVLEDSTNTKLTLKLDKEAAYTTTEVDQLFSDVADSTAASLSTKRDESQSYTITQIDTLVSGLQAASYTSSEVDTLLDEKQTTIQNNGSLDIAAIGGLGTVLSSLQPLVTSGNLSIAMTSGLQLALNTLATDIAAIPDSQIILNNNTFLNQNRFGIENGEVVLDLNLGWLFRALPLWSQVRSDPARVLQARMGHLPMQPPVSDCLLYIPFAGSALDMGPSSLNLVAQTSDTQGTWGVYDYIPPKVDSCGWLAQDAYIFPNRDVPVTAVSSRGIGWGNATSDSWLVECQVWLNPDCRCGLVLSADADLDSTAPDNINFVYVSTIDGKLGFTWDDRSGSAGHYNQPTISDAIVANRWYHIALQKNAGASTVRVYLNGNLRITVGGNLPHVQPRYHQNRPTWYRYSIRPRIQRPHAGSIPNGSVHTWSSQLRLGHGQSTDEME